MKQDDVLTPEQLDARIAIQAVRDHAQLWRLAQGKFGWRGVVVYLSPALFLSVAIALRIDAKGFGVAMRESRDAIYFVMAVAALGFVLWSKTQRQLTAVLELVKRLERARS